MTVLSRVSPDVRAVLLLMLLCLLFFWRLLTPVQADRTMLIQGDFSGQFVAFGAYQYDRLTEGEIPLWNPYNNAGLPFIADTQAAVFYPPRLLTIVLSGLTNGWGYHSLQVEMVAHVFLLTLFMYGFMRRLSLGQPGTIGASLIAAVVVGYGGFISGYPPLQLALLEAAVWLPLALLGVLEATRGGSLDWFWLLVTGLALGLTWMAGHPQTGLYTTYFVVAYMGYRVYLSGLGWKRFVGGTALFGVITFGLVAVQFIPGVEYTAYSMRSGLSFDEKGGGFPVQDVMQFVFPHIVSVWSPLFVGVTGLVLSVIAVFGRGREVIFWIGAVLVALALSLGAGGALYHLAYNFVPGLRFFRGQERAALLVAMSLAVLAGHGALYLHALNVRHDGVTVSRLLRGIVGLLVISGLFTLIVFALWIGSPQTYAPAIGSVFFSTIVVGLLLFIVLQLLQEGRRTIWFSLLVMLVVFELFSVNIDNDNYEPYRANVLDAPPYVEVIQAEDVSQPFRIDGNLYALDGNMASYYKIMDIRGTSPLFLDGPHAIIQRVLPSEVAWELFAVRYVLSGGIEIPSSSELVRTDMFGEKTVYLHRLIDPRPYALLRYQYEVLDSDDFARALLADPAFDEREVVILHDEPNLMISETSSEAGLATVSAYTPERVVIEIETPENAILSLAHVDYPGWHAELSGEPVELIRAYGGLTALAVPAGEHVLELRFNPLSYRIGAILSLLTWGVLIFGMPLWFLVRLGRSDASE